MPRRSATARASWKSSSEQQLPAPSAARRSEMPRTSWPAATRRAAATALSTPPLIATTTRVRVTSRRLAAALATDLGDQARKNVDDPVDVVPRRRRPEAHPDRAPRRVAVEPHREEHVRWFRRAGGARRPERDGDAGEVEKDEEALPRAARKPDAQRVREPLAGRWAVRDRVGNARPDALPEAL